MKKYISMFMAAVIATGILPAVNAETASEPVRQIYNVFDDYDSFADGSDINNHNSTDTGKWKYAASAENGTGAVTYKKVEKDGINDNIVVAHGNVANQARFFSDSSEITNTVFETDIMFNQGENSASQYQLRFGILTETGEKKTPLVIKWTGSTYTAKIENVNVGSIPSDSGLNIGEWLKLRIVCDSEAKTMSVTLNGVQFGDEESYSINNEGTLLYVDFKNATSDCVTYMDNTSITDGDTEIYMYYGTPEPIELEVKQGTDISKLFAEIPYVLEDGTKTGYTVKKAVTHTLTADETGTFSETAVIEETGQEVEINLTVTENYMYSIKYPLISDKNGYGAFAADSGCSLKGVKLTKLEEYSDDAVLTAVLCDKDGNKVADIASVDVVGENFEISENKTVEFDANALDFGENNPNECTILFELKDSEGKMLAEPYIYRNDVIDGTETVYIAGDSTAASYLHYQRPKTGWGEMIGYYLDNSIKVQNKAVGGRSTKSYMEEGRLDNVLESAKAGDYLFIQFGHNDRPLTVADSSADKRSVPEDYKTYLKQYIDGARECGIIPVLITSVVEGNYTDGVISENKAKYEYQLGVYADAMRDVAKEYAVPLIDAYKATESFFNEKSEEESKNYYLFCDVTDYWTIAQEDTTHFKTLGAYTVAGLIAEELRKTSVFEDFVSEPLTDYDVSEDYVTEDFEDYTENDIGKQVWSQPFELLPDRATDNFTVEYEDEEHLNKLGKMRGLDETAGDAVNERATVIFHKLAGGIGEIGMRAKLGNAVNDKIEMHIYGRESILALIRFSSDTSGQYKITTYYPGESTGTSVKLNKESVPVTYTDLSGETKQSLPAGEWFDIKFVTHEDTRSYDLYINGLEAAADVPYFNYGYEPTEEQLMEDADMANVYYRAERMYIYAGSKPESVLYIDDVYAKDYMNYAETIPMNINAYKGDECTMPETADVRLDDGHSIKKLPVTWNGTADTTQIGVQTVYGTVEGTELEASVCVNVHAFPIGADGFVLKNSNGQVFSKAADETTVGIRLVKYTNKAVDANVYVCVYDGEGRLESVKAISTSDAADWEQDTVHVFDAGLQADKDSVLCAYVMDDKIVPLTEKTVFDDTVKDEVKIFLAGDSTVCPYKDDMRPQAGWGEYIGNFFGENVAVVNKAAGSRSTKSFYNEGRLDAIIDESEVGDYLFIQLGHNDTGSPRSSHTEAQTTYKEYLRLYVNKAREDGMYPVLVTPVERFGFVDDVMKSRHGDYPQAMIEVAEKMNVPLIDLREKSSVFFTKLGEEASKPYYMVSVEPYTDYTHLTELGAEAMAELVAESISELALPIAEHMNVE